MESVRRTIEAVSGGSVTTQALLVSGVGLLFVTAFLYLFFMSGPSSTSLWANCTEKLKKWDDRGVETKDEEPLKDIWEAGGDKRRCTDSDVIRRPNKHAEGKPFGSSYYYAHNSNRTGGYKDGLRMEDYTMNGPRLLSKGGNLIEGIEQPTKATATTAAEAAVNASTPTSCNARVNNRNTMPVTERPPIPITKYLWDDPGDPKGVATIRIDGLSSSFKSDTLISWKEASVIDSKVKLINQNKGLLLLVKSRRAERGDTTTYQLLIPRLYGNVDSVKKVDKGKRLLIRLFKTIDPTEKIESTKAWPHPYRSSP